ncbi:hypothetical protein M885DRAFT_185332 [Pelagophyceae sp. CCMP2097]|nr:hypothetical protein M885DRAFT_185332 [Pelagophyceae sp. CCMP2097]
MLIAKANLLKLYLAAGFSVDGPSAVVHGSEPWLQCSLDCKWATDIVVVDSFTEMAFSGNPAAVVFLEDVPHDEIALEKWMQNVALENNLSETAFVTCQGGAQANIRYFSPTCEVDLCGHATLAAAHALFSSRRVAGPRVDFATKRAGAVAAELRADGLIELDFPLDENPPRINDPTLAAALAAALKLASAPANVHRTAMNDVQCEIEKAEVILGLEPDMALLAAIDCRLVVPYAAGARAAGEADYTYRCFGPRVGIPEDPVTGSAQCALAPLFKSRYGKDEVIGHQASKRGGVVRCRVEAGRVRIAGGAVETLRGKIPPPQTPARD